MTPPIDISPVVDRLKEGDLSTPQAQAIGIALNDTLGQVASKEDVQDLKKELKEDVQDLKKEFKEDVQDLKKEFKEDINDLKETLRNEFKSSIDNVKTELKGEIRVIDAKLSMLMWFMGGLGFGILLLLVKAFWLT